MTSQSFRKALVAILVLLLPSVVLRIVLRSLKVPVRGRARIGFSLVVVDTLAMDDGARIGHFNVIACRRLTMRQRARIGSLNLIRGHFSLRMHEGGVIARKNQATRAYPPVVSLPASLVLHRHAVVTTGHRLDCTSSIRLGEYSILAGSGTQVWTHGYMHDLEGPGRCRIDGPVDIGRNVYVGARCTFNLGVRVGAAAILGAGLTVSRSLEPGGMYVSAAIRALPRPMHPAERPEFERLNDPRLCETVYRKRTRST